MRIFVARPFTTAVAILGLIASLGIGVAQAHAKLVSSDPAPNATVAAPKTIHLQFNEEIAKKLSSFKLTDTDGNAVATTATDNKDEKTLEATPNAALTPGVYSVAWTAVTTDDGHKTSGSFSFTVK
jgi:methionine-rich copper-binding protein CopC